MNKGLTVLGLILILPLVCATPTLVKSTMQVEIINNSMSVYNDGFLVFTEAISVGNNTVNYNKFAESIVIKELGNATEIAQLITQLKTYNEDCTINKTASYNLCLDEKRNLTTQLDMCLPEKGYKDQFNSCSSAKTTLQTNYDKAVNDKNIFGIGGLILGAIGVYFFLKQSGKMVDTPKEQRRGYSEAERH
jgi:hypothetical protein